MQNTTVYLINLDGSDDRLAAADAQLKRASIKYQRVSAFDGRGIDPDSFPEYDAKRSVSYYGRPLTGGEIGCYFSHISCAQAFLETDKDYALILEDDVLFTPQAFEILQGILGDLAQNDLPVWDMINLCQQPKKMYSTLKSFRSSGGRVDLVRAHYFPTTTTAILWSRKGAERFLETRNSIYAPVDHFMRRWLSLSGRGFATMPALFGVSGAESDLDNEGGDGPARKRIKRSPRYFWAEFRRQGLIYLAAGWHMTKSKLGAR